MSNITLDVTFEGEDALAAIGAADRAGWVFTTKPASLSIDFVEHTGLSLSAALQQAKSSVQYDHDLDLVLLRPRVASGRSAIHLRRDSVDMDADRLVETLSRVPFAIASVGRFHFDWGNPAVDDDAYQAPGWGDGHHRMDWAAAFKGAGHDRLVSRRWLETGPWRLLKGPNDTSVVIFHDLDAAPEVALAQAKSGHAQIGITDETGFLQVPFNYRFDLGGLYDAADRALKVVVHGRDVPPRELLEWAAMRANQRLGPDKPIDRVLFIFPEESRARTHLPGLWRYGHECWAIVDGEETRLDSDEMPAGLTLART